MLNANGISGKRADLERLTSYTKPDVIFITETKIDSTIKSQEFLPKEYKGDICLDRKRG